MRQSLLNFLASAALSLGLAGPVVAQEAIKIGQIEAQTGPSSSLGFMATQGAKLAVHQINQAGGVEVGGKKYPIDLDSPDTQGSPQQGLIQLKKMLEHGEQRLIVAVERGEIPLNAAIAIVGAGDDDKAVQAALQEAYESGTLRGKNLLDARKVIDRRKTLGKSIAHGTPRKREQVTSTSLVRTYQKEVERQKLIVKKAEFTQHRLLFVVSALKQLFADEHFATLLRAEGLDSLPKQLAERVWAGGHPA